MFSSSLCSVHVLPEKHSLWAILYFVKFFIPSLKSFTTRRFIFKNLLQRCRETETVIKLLLHLLSLWSGHWVFCAGQSQASTIGKCWAIVFGSFLAAIVWDMADPCWIRRFPINRFLAIVKGVSFCLASIVVFKKVLKGIPANQSYFDRF